MFFLFFIVFNEKEMKVIANERGGGKNVYSTRTECTEQNRGYQRKRKADESRPFFSLYQGVAG